MNETVRELKLQLTKEVLLAIKYGNDRNNVTNAMGVCKLIAKAFGFRLSTNHFTKKTLQESLILFLENKDGMENRIVEINSLLKRELNSHVNKKAKGSIK